MYEEKKKKKKNTIELCNGQNLNNKEKLNAKHLSDCPLA